jgi:hypothetical protein
LLEDEDLYNILRKIGIRYTYVVSDGQIVQKIITVAGEVDRERTISVLYSISHDNYPFKFQSGL